MKINLKKLIQYSLNALKIENEKNLCFVFTEMLKTSKYLRERPIRAEGAITIRLSFINFIIRNLSFKNKSQMVQTDLLFFADSKNQLQSFNEIIIKSEGYGFESTLLTPEKVTFEPKPLDNSNYKQIKIHFSILDIISCLFLMLFRRNIRKTLIAGHSYKNIIVKKYYNNYLMPYILLPFYVRLLAKIQPKIVMVSNDHNISTRTLRLAAEVLGIKTAYLQHAFVATTFPPLNFDYAFLDGHESMKVYAKCNDNFDEFNSLNCMVLLTGQKKLILTNKPEIDFCVGVACNLLDEYEELEKLLLVLNKQNIKVVVRPHPRQTKLFVEKLINLSQTMPLLSFSNSLYENQNDFFYKISLLLAGNSSIHLEANIANLNSYYVALGKEPVVDDYYGFIASGLISYFTLTSDDLTLSALLKMAKNNSVKSKVVKLYSETYDTKWQSNESELVLKTLNSIIKYNSIPKLYHSIQKFEGFKDIYALSSADN